MRGDFDSVNLGLTVGLIRIADGDPGWPEASVKLARRLRRVLNGLVVAVEPIGSTAVPGLAAKPILDIAAALDDHTRVGDLSDALAGLGFAYRGDAGTEGGHVYALDDPPGRRLVTLHAVRRDDAQWDRYLAVRDRLRADPVARKAYEDLKHRLAVEHRADRRGYTNAKTDFIIGLVSGA